jgi:L-threonylcarbamoyladenylate synthase
VESTIVALRQDGSWQVLRPGPITSAQLEALLGAPSTASGSAIEAPGQLESHYAPGKPVRLNASAAEPDEFFIGFGAIAGDSQLSMRADLAEAASRLYAALHEAAAAPQPRIAVASVPSEGIGAAINDRLRRAAA